VYAIVVQLVTSKQSAHSPQACDTNAGVALHRISYLSVQERDFLEAFTLNGCHEPSRKLGVLTKLRHPTASRVDMEENSRLSLEMVFAIFSGFGL
jgi:hypothetical protein